MGTGAKEAAMSGGASKYRILLFYHFFVEVNRFVSTGCKLQIVYCLFVCSYDVDSSRSELSRHVSKEAVTSFISDVTSKISNIK